MGTFFLLFLIKNREERVVAAGPGGFLVHRSSRSLSPNGRGSWSALGEGLSMLSFYLGLLCFEQRATHKWPFKARNDWHCPGFRTCHCWLLCDPVTAPGRASGGLEAPCLQVSGADDTGVSRNPSLLLASSWQVQSGFGPRARSRSFAVGGTTVSVENAAPG